MTENKQSKYVCEYCNYRTQRRLNFEAHKLTGKHERNVKNATKKKHKCSECNKRFSHISSMYRHKKIHKTKKIILTEEELDKIIQTLEKTKTENLELKKRLEMFQKLE